jgi:hypothetical protein
MAREIRIDRAKAGTPEVITIDGEPFPFAVAGDHDLIRASIDVLGVCTVYLPVLADRVVFDDGMAGTAEPSEASSDA